METLIEKPTTAPLEKLAYNADEACAALGIGRTSLWRLEKRGLIRAVPGLRCKLFSVDSLKRFANGKAAA